MQWRHLASFTWAARFPPGVGALFPDVEPACQITEPRFVNSIRPWLDIRTVGMSWVRFDHLDPDPSLSCGLPNVLNLLDASPAYWTRWRSFQRLKRSYLGWQREGWTPEIILVNCGGPIYNAFIRWLRKRRGAPKLVLFLGDGATLGEPVSAWRRFRYRLKPMVWFEEEMLPCYDACVGASRDAAHFLTDTNRPWLWLVPGADTQMAVRGGDWPHDDHPVFGYFGSLGEYSGLPALVDFYHRLDVPNRLLVAGYGKNANLVKEYASKDPRIDFAGTLKPGEPVQFAQRCDIMINPRPTGFGNRYSFPSKLLDYGLTGRTILSARMSGADEVLGPEAFYFDPKQFEESLAEQVRHVGALQRTELQTRGRAIQERLLRRYNWEAHGAALSGFLLHLLKRT